MTNRPGCDPLIIDPNTVPAPELGDISPSALSDSPPGYKSNAFAALSVTRGPPSSVFTSGLLYHRLTRVTLLTQAYSPSVVMTQV